MVIELYVKQLDDFIARVKLSTLPREHFAALGVCIVERGVSLLAYTMGDDWTLAALRKLVTALEARPTPGRKQ